MTRELHIVPTRMMNAISDGLDAIPSLPKDIVCNCASCGYPMRFPLLVRDRDIDAMQKLLEIGRKYLADRDVLNEMIAEIQSACTIAIAKGAVK